MYFISFRAVEKQLKGPIPLQLIDASAVRCPVTAIKLQNSYNWTAVIGFPRSRSSYVAKRREENQSEASNFVIDTINMAVEYIIFRNIPTFLAKSLGTVSKSTRKIAKS